MLLAIIDEPNKDPAWKLYQDHAAIFMTAYGSVHNHQSWPGGYADHITEVMNIAVKLYSMMNNLRPLTFTLSDALLVLYLHDIEKPWKYVNKSEGGLVYAPGMETKTQHHDFRVAKLQEYGFILTPDQLNGLIYVEGESSNYNNQGRVSNPLAAFCHMCDVASARIWFDHPYPTDDPWKG
jgi:hypothetical protein